MQSGGVAVKLMSSVWMVDFGKSLTGKVIVVSNAFTTADGNSSNRGPTGSIPGNCTALFVAASENDHTVAAVTTSTAGANEAHAFFSAAF